jgi:GR25 family glycosyltransferase involved in LPS biosynthesis
MKNLTDWFDRVYVLNCAHRPDRLAVTKKHLDETGMVDADKVIYYPAIIGDWVTCPADWRSGRGAWGCMRSHQRILEDVIHARDDKNLMTLKNVLVMEDDVVFREDALENLNKFMEEVPDNWGQIYLGGQHTRDMSSTELPNVFIGNSVNRTHAYAVNQPTFTHFYRHISYATDYRGSTNHHIDHQLETAHRRKDWKVFCPREWVVGQRAGASDINGAVNNTNFW